MNPQRHDTDPGMTMTHPDETNISLEIFDHQTSEGDQYNPGKDREFNSFTTSWRFTFERGVNLNDLMKIFIYMVEKNNLEILEQMRNECIVIAKTKFGLKDLILKCIPCMRGTKVTSFRFICQVEGRNTVTAFEFKGMTGRPKQVQRCFDDFRIMLRKNNVEGTVDINRVIAPVIYSSSGGKGRRFNTSHNQEYQNLVSDRTMIDTRERGADLEVNKIVEINRLISSDKYSIGKRVIKFREEFLAKLEESEKPDLVQLMANLDAFSHSIHDSLVSEGNLGSQSMRSWLPMAHFAVEKYVFENVYDEFYAEFKKISAKTDDLFIEQNKKLQELTPKQILDNLEIKKKFRLKEEQELSGNLYQDAVLELNKLDLCKTPRDKLDCLIMMNSRMRSSVIKYHKASVEIESMDDELPICIYIMTQCNCHNIFSDLEFIETFIKCHGDMDNEERIVMNTRVAAMYISTDWDISTIK